MNLDDTWHVHLGRMTGPFTKTEPCSFFVDNLPITLSLGRLGASKSLYIAIWQRDGSEPQPLRVSAEFVHPEQNSKSRTYTDQLTVPTVGRVSIPLDLSLDELTGDGGYAVGQYVTVHLKAQDPRPSCDGHI
jgi:hypothetical protein